MNLIARNSPKGYIPLRVYGGIALTTLGRFFWVVRVAKHWHVYEYKERTAFALGMLEVLRRAYWVVLRAETEGLRRKPSNV